MNIKNTTTTESAGEDDNKSINSSQDTPTSTAAYQVLNLPELLEEILLQDLCTLSRSHPLSQNPYWAAGWKRLTQLRKVCKTWSQIIDYSPSLGRIVYRHPSICSRSITTEGLNLCEPFMASLCIKVGKMKEIRNFGGVDTSASFLEFRDKIAPPAAGGFAFPNVFISQPAVKAVYIRFSGVADSSWLKDYEDFVRSIDYSRVASGGEYSYHHTVLNRQHEDDSNGGGSGGVRAEDLVTSLILVISKFFSFGGEFRNITIDFSVGNSIPSNGKQYLSTVYSRRIWKTAWYERFTTVGKSASVVVKSGEERTGSIGLGILRRISGVFSRADISSQRRSSG
ncbi:hypothetical protein TWF192_011178 [Orbilia oligospora]|uniref:F-box domain-containing protein n=1 Tax=Orbilia oligospora TaxID=2813651 RepID=A0A6G1MI46_ORBOL|nr:hypothetical protein TWF679_009643 [Orbilia oligospora]KAF3221057.1 hypothetical protein TWF191_007264 [Orbilia oligospora]KAF3259045.1 hypothetical protein TWF192_011178 [Orbilia oligospora]